MKRIDRALLRTLLLILLCCQHPLSAEKTVFRNITVFTGKEVLPQQMVIIQEDTVEYVGPETVFPKNATIINGEGHTLLPGLIDAHVHVISREALRQSLNFGVTTVIDMFMSVNMMNEIKKEQAGNPAGEEAFLVSAGMIFTAPGGHGTQYGIPCHTITSPEQADSLVAECIAMGSDFIKIIYDNGNWMNRALPSPSRQELKQVITAAHKHDMKAVVHVLSIEEAITAVESGADGLAHIYCEAGWSEKLGRLLAENDLFIIPTLSVHESMCRLRPENIIVEDTLLGPWLSPGGKMLLQNRFPLALDGKNFTGAANAVNTLNTLGIKLLAGTDAPNPGTTYGASLHREMELLVNAGLTPVEALISATRIPADVFGLSHRGRIEKGAVADLVMVSGKPHINITDTKKIESIWKQGKIVQREKYQH